MLAKPLEKPNVVVILTDDMGYLDTGFSGGPVIETPNLDKLAEGGMILTDFMPVLHGAPHPVLDC